MEKPKISFLERSTTSRLDYWLQTYQNKIPQFQRSQRTDSVTDPDEQQLSNRVLQSVMSTQAPGQPRGGNHRPNWPMGQPESAEKQGENKAAIIYSVANPSP